MNRTVVLTCTQETDELARTFAMNAQQGTVYLLSGELGAGKSSFARAFIRAYFNDPDMDVPSPTYTLVQVYEPDKDTSLTPVHHLDLYRLMDSQEIEELGIDYLKAITLIEWPERLPESEMPPSFIRIKFSIAQGVHIADIASHNM